METVKFNDISVMDERIIALNKIIALKLSDVSKNRREGVKAIKFAAQYVLKKWNDALSLKKFIDDKDTKIKWYELWCIAKSRYDQLSVIKNDETKAETAVTTSEANKTNNPIADKKQVRSKHVNRQVGDVHPNGKWIWTEWAPGKFDWKSKKGKYHNK